MRQWSSVIGQNRLAEDNAVGPVLLCILFLVTLVPDHTEVFCLPRHWLALLLSTISEFGWCYLYLKLAWIQQDKADFFLPPIVSYDMPFPPYVYGVLHKYNI